MLATLIDVVKEKGLGGVYIIGNFKLNSDAGVSSYHSMENWYSVFSKKKYSVRQMDESVLCGYSVKKIIHYEINIDRKNNQHRILNTGYLILNTEY